MPLENILTEMKKAISEITDEQALNEIKTKYLGKKVLLQSFPKKLKICL